MRVKPGLLQNFTTIRRHLPVRNGIGLGKRWCTCFLSIVGGICNGKFKTSTERRTPLSWDGGASSSMNCCLVKQPPELDGARFTAGASSPDSLSRTYSKNWMPLQSGTWMAIKASSITYLKRGRI